MKPHDLDPLGVLLEPEARVSAGPKSLYICSTFLPLRTRTRSGLVKHFGSLRLLASMCQASLRVLYEHVETRFSGGAFASLW